LADALTSPTALRHHFRIESAAAVEPMGPKPFWSMRRAGAEPRFTSTHCELRDPLDASAIRLMLA
jgi:hypothetical protein